MNRMNFGGKLAKWFLTAAAWAFCLTGTALAAGNMPEAVDGTKGVNTRENYENLFDGSTGTKWCVRGTNPYVIFKLPSSVSVTGYTLVTGNDSASCAGRNPHSWTLYGCNASQLPDPYDSRWVLLDTVTDDTVMQDVNGTDYYFALPQTSAAYNYYMLWIDEKNSGIMQLPEFSIAYEGSSFGFTGLDGSAASAASSGSGTGQLLCAIRSGGKAM